MGSGNHTKETAQSLANKIISVAEIRKDAVAFVSPHRGAFLSDGSAGSVTVFNDTQITDNVISFFAPVSSSSIRRFSELPEAQSGWRMARGSSVAIECCRATSTQI